ncbi:ROK family protein [Paenibacillus sp. JTLBN-2024]
MYLTLGTGLGSAFVNRGRLVKQGEGVPEEGWLYRLPYRDGVLDDYFSRRGIVRLAEEMGVPQVAHGDEDVKLLAARARDGEMQVVQLFRQFGEKLSEALLPWIGSFQPDEIVIGGQIAKSGGPVRLRPAGRRSGSNSGGHVDKRAQRGKPAFYGRAARVIFPWNIGSIPFL